MASSSGAAAQGISDGLCNVTSPSITTFCSVHTRTPGPSVTTAATQWPCGSITNGLASRPVRVWIITRCSAGPAIAVEPAASESMIAWLVRSESARITALSSGFASTSTGACASSTGTCTAASTTGEPATTATPDTTSSLRAIATRSWSAVPMSSLPCEATTCSPTIRRTARNSSRTGRHHSSVSKRSMSVCPSTWLFNAACSGPMLAISVALASSAVRCAFQAVSTLRRAASAARRACGLLLGSMGRPPIR